MIIYLINGKPFWVAFRKWFFYSHTLRGRTTRHHQLFPWYVQVNGSYIQHMKDKGHLSTCPLLHTRLSFHQGSWWDAGICGPYLGSHILAKADIDNEIHPQIILDPQRRRTNTFLPSWCQKWDVYQWLHSAQCSLSEEITQSYLMQQGLDNIQLNGDKWKVTFALKASGNEHLYAVSIHSLLTFNGIIIEFVCKHPNSAQWHFLVELGDFASFH